ncbi:MAG: hypothetical protein B6242_01755 [Anaerolineaceae bacterium 4572_78]|nr:MAG: hypothetical protein B6242_01755 [Anaerolineaceae bacterium 4572_78]
MFQLFRRKQLALEHIETVIGPNTSFEGHLKCDGNIRIDGVCHAGTIETLGNVVVAHDGRVMANIIAENVSVAGEVHGAIFARGRLEILSTGRVLGDVQVSNFYKDDGAILSGNLVMKGQQEALLQLETAQGILPSHENT